MGGFLDGRLDDPQPWSEGWRLLTAAKEGAPINEKWVSPSDRRRPRAASRQVGRTADRRGPAGCSIASDGQRRGCGGSRTAG